MKRTLLGVSVLLIIVLSVKIYFHFDASRHTHLEQVKPEGKWPEAPSSNSTTNAGNESVFTKIAPLCAPGSTVYLTQSEQDYRNPERKPNPPEVKQAQREGAEAKITLRVVDSRGVPVPNANVRVAFFHRGSCPIDGESDTNGFFTAEHRSGADVQFHVSKVGYYKTFRNYWFFREGTQCVKDDRWVPWNPTLEVVLKEKRNPVSLIYKSIESRMPVYDKPIGFDFAIGDWVNPYGQGQYSDMMLTYSEALGTNVSRRYDFCVAFTNVHSGAYVLQTDRYSQLLSEYTAATNGYLPILQFTYERTDTQIIHDKRLDDDHMIVFRVRTELDANGDLASAFYGKIYGPFKFADGPQRFVRFAYYFNPRPNDQNLEAEGRYP